MRTRLCAAAPALALAGGAMITAARADDAFGAWLTNQPIDAARSYWQPNDQTRLVQHYAIGTPGTPGVVSTVPTVDGRADIVGHHGPQDDLAREIYRPGSRPAGW